VLSNSFIHIPGLGGHTERSLWQQGCLTWEDYLKDPGAWTTGRVSQDAMTRAVEQSAEALEKQHHQHFAEVLGGKNMWRAWPEFRETAVYLDIETDGGMYADSITTVGLYDGSDFTCLVKDDTLGSFPDVISRYGMIVTFFGTGFDVPMLKKAFPSVPFDQIHLDLCPTLKQLGIRGGLKRIEKQMGIARGDDTEGLDGRDAIYLWRYYQRGDDKALETLIAYNKEDVVNLETLAEIAYNRLRAGALREAGLSESFGRL
jgi:uncharacterized protein YprB with RNaseH-like and TPR domain